MNVSHLSCNFVISEPTGFINRAIPESFLAKYNLNAKAPQEASSSGTSAAAMLRERDAQLGLAPQDVAPIVNDGNEQWAKVNGDGGNMADDEAEEDRGYKQDSESSPKADQEVSATQSDALDSFTL